jgi:hypothetical protein
LVAVAACVSAAGASVALAAPPVNDNYLSSLIIPQAATTGSRPVGFEDVRDTAEATTQADLFNPDRSGLPLGGAGPEPLSCHGSTYGKTVWYDLHPSVNGGVEIVASGFPTAIAVYQFNPATAMLGHRVGCQLSSTPTNDFALPFDLKRHRAYTVQLGGLATASGFDSGPLDVKVTFFPDHDGDSVFDVLDSCPKLPGVARFGGCPPTIHAIPRYTFTTSASGVRLTGLRVDQVPGGSRVQARCHSCGVSQVRNAGAHASSVTMTAFQGAAFPVGAKLEIWITKRATGTHQYRYGAIGSYISYSVLTGGTIQRGPIRCLMPGSLVPRQKCG